MQYPTYKVDVSDYQQDVADIMEESMEEQNNHTSRRHESVTERKMSKIKKILNSPPKQPTQYLPPQAAMVDDKTEGTDAVQFNISSSNQEEAPDYNIVR